jgi:hypothetical protein
MLKEDGGGRSHMRTLLRRNSLLTGKNTGNFTNSANWFRLLAAVKCFILGSFRSQWTLVALNITGNYQRHIREFRVAYQGIKFPLRVTGEPRLGGTERRARARGVATRIAVEITGLVLKSADLVSRQEKWLGEQQSHL